jgi:hypothetical protein
MARSFSTLPRTVADCCSIAKLIFFAAVSSAYIFRQLVDEASNTYTYLLADAQTKEAVLIDPVLEQVRFLQDGEHTNHP